jgi:hypothetical protein
MRMSETVSAVCQLPSYSRSERPAGRRVLNGQGLIGGQSMMLISGRMAVTGGLIPGVETRPIIERRSRTGDVILPM